VLVPQLGTGPVTKQRDPERGRRRARRTSRVALVAFGLVGVLGFGAAPASAASKPTAKQWAGSLCTAFLDFGDSVDSTLKGLQGSGSVDAAAASAKQGVDNAVKSLQSTLDSLGKPPTPNASAAQSEITSLGDDLSKDASAIETALTPTPSSPTAVAATFASIGSTVQKGVSQVKSTASDLQSMKGQDELKKGFQQASSCQQLKSDL